MIVKSYIYLRLTTTHEMQYFETGSAEHGRITQVKFRPSREHHSRHNRIIRFVCLLFMSIYKQPIISAQSHTGVLFCMAKTGSLALTAYQQGCRDLTAFLRRFDVSSLERHYGPLEYRDSTLAKYHLYLTRDPQSARLRHYTRDRVECVYSAGDKEEVKKMKEYLVSTEAKVEVSGDGADLAQRQLRAGARLKGHHNRDAKYTSSGVTREIKRLGSLICSAEPTHVV